VVSVWNIAVMSALFVLAQDCVCGIVRGACYRLSATRPGVFGRSRLSVQEGIYQI